jgi:hypothetical protein
VSSLTEAEAADRIAMLEARCFPSVMIWPPELSASGQWEALGKGWLIKEADPGEFHDKLKATLAGRNAPAGGTGPVVPPAGQGQVR